MKRERFSMPSLETSLYVPFDPVWESKDEEFHKLLNEMALEAKVDNIRVRYAQGSNMALLVVNFRSHDEEFKDIMDINRRIRGLKNRFAEVFGK